MTSIKNNIRNYSEKEKKHRASIAQLRGDLKTNQEKANENKSKLKNFSSQLNPLTKNL